MTLNVVSFNLQLKSSGISNSKVLVVYFTLHAVGMLHAPEGLHHLPKDIKPHTLASHLELDPETNWGKFLDPYPNINYIKIGSTAPQEKVFVIVW